MKIRMARELTNPTITDRGANRISRATPRLPRMIWKSPPTMTVAIRYPSPCSRASGATTRAMAPVAAEIMAGRPPTNAIVTAMVNEANSPTLGSTPAMIENEIASGISASATTRPDSTSVRSSLAVIGCDGVNDALKRLARTAGRDTELQTWVIAHPGGGAHCTDTAPATLPGAMERGESLDALRRVRPCAPTTSHRTPSDHQHAELPESRPLEKATAPVHGSLAYADRSAAT